MKQLVKSQCRTSSSKRPAAQTMAQSEPMSLRYYISRKSSDGRFLGLGKKKRLFDLPPQVEEQSSTNHPMDNLVS